MLHIKSKQPPNTITNTCNILTSVSSWRALLSIISFLALTQFPYKKISLHFPSHPILRYQFKFWGPPGCTNLLGMCIPSQVEASYRWYKSQAPIESGTQLWDHLSVPEIWEMSGTGQGSSNKYLVSRDLWYH